MRKRHLLVFLAAALLLVAFSSCQVNTPAPPTIEMSQVTRSTAATAQAELNLLQNEAWLLEQDLDANFSDHYVGMTVHTYPSLKVIVYLTNASKSELQPFVKNAALFDAIEVREEAISRQSLRATRETFKTELDNVGVTHTTEIKMEPARLLVYVYDAAEAKELLSAAGFSIPENVELIEAETLPGGG
ncbi:MAG: hypothetical protein PHW11_03810 [Anaerolineaceae bacterium]|jgi:hypothetical protein|nr:hypothetical protein [Anaerolineaceae bacterium]MDD4042619.1 hypothetical protein [Anaerolineaceae bacterium]MDD4577834.1 hypothetical protein [Anaerolineaceae bacterium]